VRLFVNLAENSEWVFEFEYNFRFTALKTDCISYLKLTLHYSRSVPQMNLISLADDHLFKKIITQRKYGGIERGVMHSF